jgi:membrane-associated phospholipid phosphatase
VGIVLVLRAHYTLDVITGALAAWFAVDLAARLAPALDALLN